MTANRHPQIVIREETPADYDAIREVNRLALQRESEARLVDQLLTDVELNRNFNGLTPRAKEVKAGEYEVKLRKKGFEEWVKTLTVEPGQTVIVHAELRTPGQGSLD